MPEPISSSAATSTLTGLALLFTLPGVDPSVVLGALTGAVLFISAAEEQGRLRRIALFVDSFVSGLLLAGFTCQLLEVLLPASVQVSNAIGSLIASAMMVRLLQLIMRNQDRLLEALFNKRGQP